MWLAIGSLSAFLAVAAGAFGAHALRDNLTPDDLAIYETGARYHMYHALALVAVGLLARRTRSALVAASGWLFLIGTLLFSGSLYTLAFTGARWLGAITPFGGAGFLLGWLALAWAGIATRPKRYL